jgi:predicted Zn-dependent protease
MSWTEKEAKALAAMILAESKAPECELQLSRWQSSFSRFAANEVTTAGSVLDTRVQITSRRDGKTGEATVSDLSPDSLTAAVRLSEQLMELAPPDPEWVEGLGPQKYPTIAGFHGPTAAASPAQRLRGVKAGVELARAEKLEGSGFFESEARYTAIANKKGNFGFHRSTSVGYSTTMRTPDGTGSGWAGVDGPKLSDVDGAALARRAANKAKASAQPRPLTPGKYTVILEPRAVVDLLGALPGALGARRADEGRSFFSRPGGGVRIGDKLFADSVTIRSDPFAPQIPGRPWAGEGLPAQATTWIEKGVLKALSSGRYWARKTKREPLPFSGSLIMEGAAKGGVDDLVKSCQRGLLVTRFWYIRSVNPQTIQLTGLTRDGVWLVEKGAIVAPVNNLRFNESPANLLANIEALGAAVSTGDAVVPPILAREFNFSSVSDAV